MKYSPIVFLAALFTAGVFAQENQQQGLQDANIMATEAEFISLDANKDGKLTKQEASIDEKLVEQFSEVDTDLNGEISQMEYILFVTQPTAAGKE
ncbi:MAG: hypothetical protein CSB48_05205 [Proteobacteria bacterium]|nr:MAG: hypothetical protein CSB48_05205 [Pseudomonadota bacterium]